MPLGPSFRQGRYTYERVAFKADQPEPFRWTSQAWLWEGGWIEDEPVRDYVLVRLTFLYWLALAFHNRRTFVSPLVELDRPEEEEKE